MERDCVRMLRTHVEILEGLHLALHPVPSSVTEYKKLLAERKQQLCENEDILRAISNELETDIKWPATMEEELKDAIRNKVNKHFRIWIWLLYMVDSPEIRRLRETVGDDPVAMRHLASGIAGLYIYASVEIRELKNYTKEEMKQHVREARA